ncbi:MAG: BMP family ABC transporter substrate-binding protein [Spirochaetales bacterium]|nr:BMP family ABC transporter substrate-binding protein [Spirochaetales bacterium]
MKKKTALIPSFILFFLLSCASSPVETDQGMEKNVPLKAGAPPRIAVLVTAEDLAGSSFGKEIMIGVSRTAQEFGGTIIGTETTVFFGETIELTVIPTAFEEGALSEELPELHLDQYDLVFGCGYMFREPLVEIRGELPDTHFVIVDTYGDFPEEWANITSLEFHTADTAFLAGILAVHTVKGAPLGFLGGMDTGFIREEFLDGFIRGVEYADSLLGVRTSVHIAFAESFTDPDTGYRLAMEMYGKGVQCIYQAAGKTGDGGIRAAADAEKWIIGVDTDQGLERAGKPEGTFILTSTMKKWGTGLYLVCREYLDTGKVPPGVQVVGLKEDCVALAINPYNTPLIEDHFGLIASVEASLEQGVIPSAVSEAASSAWTSVSRPKEKTLTSLAVNLPEINADMDTSCEATLQRALSTAFHETGRYRVISREQKDRLLEEISMSMEATSEEKQQLEVGRLIAAEVIVFSNLDSIGSMYIFDAKIVDVQTGITLSVCSENFSAVEDLFQAVPRLAQNLAAY